MNSDGWHELRKSNDYREFLRKYIECRSLTQSELAQASGFGRGFPGDIISGRRRMTAKACHSFEKGMKSLPARGKKLFRMLVARDERDEFPELKIEKVLNSIEELRSRPWQKTRTDDSSSLFDVFSSSGAPLVFAASGSPETGAELGEIVRRTGLSRERVSAISRKLERVGVFKIEGERIFPSDLHLFLQNQSERNQALVSFFREGCREALKKLPDSLNSENDFFFSSYLTVSEEKLPDLKKALRQTILNFAEDSIDHEGNKMVRLTTAFHQN